MGQKNCLLVKSVLLSSIVSEAQCHVVIEEVLVLEDEVGKHFIGRNRNQTKVSSGAEAGTAQATELSVVKPFAVGLHAQSEVNSKTAANQ